MENNLIAGSYTTYLIVKKSKPDVNHSISSMVTEGRRQVIRSVKDQFFQTTLQRIIPLLCPR